MQLVFCVTDGYFFTNSEKDEENKFVKKERKKK
jgi:hypothetical protein